MIVATLLQEDLISNLPAEKKKYSSGTMGDDSPDSQLASVVKNKSISPTARQIEASYVAVFLSQLESGGSANKHQVWWPDLIGIALLSFQASAQIVATRAMMAKDTPTVVLTALYTDLMGEWWGEKEDRKRKNRRWVQVRRVLCAVAVFLGALVVGICIRTETNVSAALWIACAIKMVIAACWCFWRKKRVAVMRSVNGG